jgi:hypothetical protein
LDIRQVKGPVHIPGGWAWLWLVLALVALAAAAFAAYQRWWRKARPAEPKPVVPPHVRARQQLAAALELIGQPEPFCVAVSGIVRVYLEERFSLRAPERTTEEFLEELTGSALLSLGQQQGLAGFLTRCDLVKFARYDPGEPELLDLHDAAVRLVDETEPRPLEAVGSSAMAPCLSPDNPAS